MKNIQWYGAWVNMDGINKGGLVFASSWDIKNIRRKFVPY